MPRRKRVLWIEDKAQLELAFLVPPVLLDGRYDLEVAHDATEAVALLADPKTHGEFDLLIFDLDLPPGEWDIFAAFYKRYERRGEEPAMLGLELLSFLRTGRWVRGDFFTHAENYDSLELLLKQMRRIYQSKPIGILSIYTDHRRDNLVELLGLGPEQRPEWEKRLIVPKHAGLPRTALLQLIRDLEGWAEAMGA